MDATIEEIAKHGLHNLSAKEVAAKLNCSSALIYKYFENNDILIERCSEVIAERRYALLNEILEYADFSDTNHPEANERLAYCFLKRFSEYPNDCLFTYSLVGTKYNWIISKLDDRARDPLYQALLRSGGWTLETVPMDVDIAYDCTMEGLRSLLNAMVMGLLQKTDEEMHRVAKMLARGVMTLAKEKIGKKSAE